VRQIHNYCTRSHFHLLSRIDNFYPHSRVSLILRKQCHRIPMGGYVSFFQSRDGHETACDMWTRYSVTSFEGNLFIRIATGKSRPCRMLPELFPNPSPRITVCINSLPKLCAGNLVSAILLLSLFIQFIWRSQMFPKWLNLSRPLQLRLHVPWPKFLQRMIITGSGDDHMAVVPLTGGSRARDDTGRGVAKTIYDSTGSDVTHRRCQIGEPGWHTQIRVVQALRN
jgi:hypothetical protein